MKIAQPDIQPIAAAVASLQLLGFHHLTAITAAARENHAFYTQTLGMRLVKKTVNQDDVSAYHLFYADGAATPGTDITFFDWPTGPERRGTSSIVRTGLRVAGSAALAWWERRLAELNVAHNPIAERDGRPTLDLQDPEGQRLSLVADDETVAGIAHPWPASPVPAENQIRGLGPITLSVPRFEPTDAVLTQLLQMRRIHEYGGADGAATHVYQMDKGGSPAELHVAVEPARLPARSGAGGVHHVAFRTPSDEQYQQWIARLADANVPSSGPVDRYYFKSLYFREPGGILFEIATDGPGFATDEPMEKLGQRLALPPFLEPHRKEIEAGLKAL
jgi:glyoxalase family protein